MTRDFLVILAVGMITCGLIGEVLYDNLSVGVGFGLSAGIIFHFLFRH